MSGDNNGSRAYNNNGDTMVSWFGGTGTYRSYFWFNYGWSKNEAIKNYLNSFLGWNLGSYGLTGSNTLKPSGYVYVYLCKSSVRFRIHAFALMDRPYYMPTPSTPTPTPVQSYCSSVEAEGEEEDLESLLPRISIVRGNCVGWQEVSVSLPVIGDITIPGLQVCFNLVEFGSINLFGMRISLDLLALIVGGVMVIRWVFRS